MVIDKNLPNYLTLGRIFAIPIIVCTFYFEDKQFAHRLGAFLFSVASITDFFDGYLARRFCLVSGFGRMFDPIADKLLVGCVIVMLVKQERADVVPSLLILAREFIIAGLREFLAQVHVSVPVSRLAKIKTVVQMGALATLILGTGGSSIVEIEEIGRILLWIAALLTVFTGFSYFKACSRYF